MLELIRSIRESLKPRRYELLAYEPLARRPFYTQRFRSSAEALDEARKMNRGWGCSVKVVDRHTMATLVNHPGIR